MAVVSGSYLASFLRRGDLVASRDGQLSLVFGCEVSITRRGNHFLCDDGTTRFLTPDWVMKTCGEVLEVVQQCLEVT